MSRFVRWSRLLPTVLCICGASSRAAASPPLSAPVLERETPEAPWKARVRSQGRPKHMPALGMALIDLSKWPREPDAPSSVDRKRFTTALRQLCGRSLSRRRASTYTRWILASAKEFEVDPFLLAGLVYRQSRCDPRIRRGHKGGLATVGLQTHRPHFKRRTYHYWVLEGGTWVARTKRLGRYPFNHWTLRRSQISLYFAAALLSIFGEQCPAIDTRFDSVPHRHPVAHLIWGDRVVDAGSEDRILQARRRMIQYHEGGPLAPIGSLDGLALYSPLDGAPRKATSGLGDVRGNAHHAHRGIDFESTLGEPVRAVADGVVFRAGVDLPRRGSRPLSPERAHRFRRSRMGRGGLFVMIKHEQDLLSAYMHLDRIAVRDEQRVRGGELIGYVGRTGIRRDPSHLHFEMRRGRRVLDPVPLLGPALFGPEATYRGRLIKANQPRLWRRARHRRWLRRRALARRHRAKKTKRRRSLRRRGAQRGRTAPATSAATAP